MKRILLLAIFLFCMGYRPAIGCECGPPGHASKYVKQAALVFVGKVVFTDDDGSGQFIQHTLVHFEVEESFERLKPDVRDVWIDPGSCTSCYAEYRVGERHLVFAYGGFVLPRDTATMSTANSQCRVKPLPPGIDAQNPPTVYVAPECSGTRSIVKESESEVAKEINWLRNYKKKFEKAAK